MVSILFDLDGVLADFVRGALKVHNRPDVDIRSVPWGIEARLGITPADFWAPLDRAFAAGLEPLADGMQLLAYAEKLVGAENVGILTSPWDTPGCYEGKCDWVAKHLPAYRRRLMTGAGKHLFAGPTKILVDDRDENVDAFRALGGVGIKIPRPWNTLRWMTSADGGFGFDVIGARLRHEVEYVRQVATKLDSIGGVDCESN